jgi:hypothetical protein
VEVGDITGIHGVTSPKIALCTATAVKTSNPVTVEFLDEIFRLSHNHSRSEIPQLAFYAVDRRSQFNFPFCFRPYVIATKAKRPTAVQYGDIVYRV